MRRPGLVAIMVGGMLGVSSVAHARTPLPTIEVVKPKKRVRLLDVRGPLAFGWGYSNLWKTPVYEVGFETQASFVEITETTWLHFAFGESFVLAPYPLADGERRPGLMGLDFGGGISRYAPGGPAVFVTATGGPRWLMGSDRFVPADGAGVVGRLDVYPFYMSIPEIVKMDRRWFRKYILSGVHAWVSARYDHVQGRHTNSYAGGIGIDVGRTVLLPILQRVIR